MNSLNSNGSRNKIYLPSAYKKKPTHLHFKDKHHHRVRDGQTMKWNQEVSRSHYPTNKIDFELKLVKEIKRDTSF